MLVACQLSRILTWFPIISISLFFLGAVFYMKRLRSSTDLITCESQLHSWVSRMPCPMLSHMGTASIGLPVSRKRVDDCWSALRNYLSLSQRQSKEKCLHIKILAVNLQAAERNWFLMKSRNLLQEPCRHERSSQLADSQAGSNYLLRRVILPMLMRLRLAQTSKMFSCWRVGIR